MSLSPWTPWREVCAKRARRLHKAWWSAGLYEIRRAGRTSTGKARYQWRKRFGFILNPAYQPNDHGNNNDRAL
jgi:hypothetical protein